ncbi:sulfatase [Algoriphagus namhaensis]|uniref:Sulfatase n=1 Tax=Algoriphagus namhaensis TaxID=915353 RepID=A0ABV8ARG4_9BACT
MKRLALLIFIGLCAFEKSLAQERPNIILINIDDMGWKDLGVFGSDYYETPFLDSLAKEGLIFKQAYAAASNCAPSRASMLTGLWNTRHQMYTVSSSERGDAKDRKIIPIKNTLFLDKKFETFPQILQKIGYETIHAGKWHISPDPRDFGFKESIGGGPEGAPRNFYPPYGIRNWEGPEEDYLTDAIMTKTIARMNSVQAPFFLYYSPYAVHTPIQGKPGLAKKYVNKFSSLGQNNADYASMIENLDRNIALLFKSLQEKNQLQNTLIIFTTDHGGLKGITSQPPLRSGKGSYYEGGIRVPFFMVWQDKIKPGVNETSVITQMDLFPTLMDLLGEKSTAELDGESLIPLIFENQTLPPRSLYWHFPIYLQAYAVEDDGIRDPLFRTRPGSVIRQGDWKLHYYFEDQDVELFNLKDDIAEQTDLSNQHPEKVKELMSLLQAWWAKTEAPIPSQPNPEFKSN